MSGSATSSPSRILEIPVVPNARHLGGLPLANGSTALHDVTRSATLADLQPAGIETLRDRGIRTVVDLRTEDERVLAPEPDLSRYGITNIWLPMAEHDPAPYGVRLENSHIGFLWQYQVFLERGRPAICQLFETLASSDGGVLYHCSGGQDRTGVITSLLLSLAGATDDTILADHALSVTPEYVADRGLIGEEARQRIKQPHDAMAAFLAMLRDRWGSAEGFLLDAGTSPNAITAVRARATS